MPRERPVIAQDARKHGVNDETILHVYDNPIRIFGHDDGFTMLIGGDRSGALYELGYVEDATQIVIIHAMPARDKFLG